MHPVADLLICLRFFSRLPLPASRRETELGAAGLAAASTMVPVAGGIIGLIPAVILSAAVAVGLPTLLAAALSVAALVLATGALHEDGLADCADGFGGGRSVERKLAIMRDSHIGTFGTCALVLSLSIRIVALDAIALREQLACATAVVVAAAVSRTACLLPLVLLPPARADGLGAAAGRPDLSQLGAGAALCVALGLCLIPLGYGFAHVVFAVAAPFAAAAVVGSLARRQIRGQTGDVAGAAQQIAEIAILAVLSAS